jgi:hypothetical protein
MLAEHIIDVLDDSPIDRIDSAQLSAIRTHIGRCDTCRQAYESSVISAALLKERVAEEVQPSPFFKTRVMAAVRERQAAGLPGLAGLWKTTGAFISAMIAITVILLSLTFLGGSQTADSSGGQGMAQAYSMEQVFDDYPPSLSESTDATSGQVLDVVFAGGDAYGSSQ